jgi:hypothetical protein
MSYARATLQSPFTLGASVVASLDDALNMGVARCLWCGAEAVASVADRWTGRVVLRCPAGGSELEGSGVRRPREQRP